MSASGGLRKEDSGRVLGSAVGPIFVLELSNSFNRIETDCVGEIEYPSFPSGSNRRGPVSLRIA
jgi:hypothetical protein